VAIAPRRDARPGAVKPTLDPPTAEELEQCPFCEGREDRTPPETLALGRDDSTPDSPGWRVRVVPNLYPAFDRQEVVIHSPRHIRSIAELEGEGFDDVAEAWRLRAAAAREAGLVQFALVNEGRAAGASLPHSHSQLIWLPEQPPLAAAERGLSLDGEVVLERDGLVLLCPRVSRSRYELLVAPVDPEPGAYESPRLASALRLLAEGARRITAVEGPAPFNAWLHDTGHWHLELFPRLNVLAGAELGAGWYINALPPEEAAARLRDAG
jgi:UDPglucose--hexose-1-phosphate uridylyltransferase